MKLICRIIAIRGIVGGRSECGASGERSGGPP